MTQEMMQELSRRIVEAARLAVAMHLQQASEARDGEDTDDRLHALATGGAGWQRSMDGQQPTEDAFAGVVPIAGREAA